MNETLPDVSEYEKELDKLEDKYKKGKLSDTTFESECARLQPLIEDGHDYKFIGKVGRFTPVKPGTGGGVLCREQNGKYYAAANSTGYRWLESEMLGDDIFNVVDDSFYIKMVNDRVDDISALGDFEWFVSDDPYLGDFMNVPEYGPEEVPFA